MLCSEEVKRIIHCYDNIRSMSEDILLLHSNDVNRYLCSVAQWESPGFLMRRRRWVLLLEGVFLFSAEPPKLLAPGTPTIHNTQCWHWALSWVNATTRQAPYSHSSGQPPRQWRHGTWPIRTQCPPPSPGIWLKLCRRWELKLLLTGDSDKRSQQTITIHLGLPGLIGILPHQRSQLTTRWWSVDSSAPLFTRMSRTYRRKSNATSTKSIIELQPRVSWCQVHIWTPLCLNMVFVMDSPWRAQKSNNRTPLWFRSGGPFLPITPFQVSLSLPKWALKSPSRTRESPAGALSRCTLQ